jgi:Putative Ig domain
MATIRPLVRSAVFVLALIPFAASAQIAGKNINMVAGVDWPGGDPFLQRQNEPSVAPSTRNPMHLLAGANDYRTVDLPGLPDGEETGDAWLGVFKSTDGGSTWRSTLIPGYPQDTSPEGLAAPIKQTVNGITFPAAADPMVRSGLNGMLYYSGLATTRTNPPVGAVFVTRYNDLNNHEASDPMQYVGMSIVADGRPAGKFYDKPSLAVDLPRPGASLCSVAGQFFLGGNVYVAYTDIQGSGNNTIAKIWFSRSTDCGSTWSAPILLSGANTINQGSIMAIETRNGALYVAWRRFAHASETNAVLITKSLDGGKTFSAPVVVRSITPFEQATTTVSFRTSAYPTVVTDANGRVYVAWSERTGPAGSLVGISDKADGRIMLSTSMNGATWSAPVMAVPTAPAYPLSGRGHQFMPALSFTSSKLMLVYYDLREDSTIGHFTPAPQFSESRVLLGDLAATPQNLDNVFANYIQDAGVMTGILLRRHTLDLRASQASPGAMPVFAASQRVSQYRFGTTSLSPIDPNTGKPSIDELDFNPPNLKMFKLGTVPFFGDYIDLAPQYPFIGSILNLPIPAPVFHAVWTDNRDVRPPANGDWTQYTPVNSAANTGVSKLTGGAVPPCVVGHTGMRNQNIYTSRISAGLVFGSPGNDKPLGRIQRAYVVTVQNAKGVAQSYRLQIFNQPIGGKASFQQLPLNAPAVVTLDVTVNPRSSTSRSVFVTSTIKNYPVGVVVTEITAPGGNPSPNGLTSATVLNPDPTSPDIVQPGTVGNPDIGNAEVYNPDIGNPGYVNPDIGNPDIGNPDIGNPDIGNPDIGNPDIGNPDIGNPDIGNPDIGNPDIGNPDIGNPDIGNGSVTDTTWDATDTGNTTASYSVKLLPTGTIDPTYKLQLILHQTYRTPVARDCNLGTERHEILISNIPHPTLSTPDNVGSPDIGNPTVPTVAIAPGDSAEITVRVVDPFHQGLTIPASNFLTPVIVAHAVNTADLGNPNPQPPITLTITTQSIPSAVEGVAYSSSPEMRAIGGVKPYTWSNPREIEGNFGALPPGLSINPSTGVISGTPTAAGTYTVQIGVFDSATPEPHSNFRTYTMTVGPNPLTITTESLPDADPLNPYQATLSSAGGTAPVHWTVVGGALPTGLVLNDDGTITGTATGDSNTFTVRAADSATPQHTATATFTITVQFVIGYLRYRNAAPDLDHTSDLRLLDPEPAACAM